MTLQEHITVTTSNEHDVVWLTQEAHDKLQAELEELKGPKRDEIVARIAAAREEGDLRENGGYHAAREEQGKNEGRIRQLEDMLSRAQVGEAPEDDGTVAPGMVVTIRFAGDSNKEKFLLGAREMAGDSDLEVYSPQSPMGAALVGSSKGDTVEFEAPNGKTMKVEVVAAERFAG